MNKKLFKATTLFLFMVCLFSGLCLKDAKAEILGGLSSDTVTIRLFGWPINLAPSLNVKLSFSSPNVASLSSEAPVFMALGTTGLLTQTDPTSNTLSVIWDGLITNNEARITAKLLPGSSMGLTNISVESVKTAGGRDITNSIVSIVEKSNVANSIGRTVTPLGEFTLLDSGDLIPPGKASIAFKAENLTQDISANLNGEPVDFINNDLGIAVVDLPKSSNRLNLNLELVSNDTGAVVNSNLGVLKLERGIQRGLPPRINRAFAINSQDGTLFKVEGFQFGVRRFGEENTNLEIIPSKRELENKNLRRRNALGRLAQEECIPQGSYVNLVHPAGTDSKKIFVKGSCNRTLSD